MGAAFPRCPRKAGRLAANLRASTNLRASIRQFGSSCRPPKEGAIERLILKLLRRRIFAKLGISAQGEIVLMFRDVLEKPPWGRPKTR